MENIKNAIEIIKYFEGCKLVSYRNNDNTWTIGYGNTSYASENTKINNQKAIELLSKDLKLVSDFLDDNINGTNLKQNEREALISLIFNINTNQFLNSSVYKHIIKWDRKMICESMIKYVKVFDHAYLGLERRRLTEAALFVNDLRYKDFYHYKQLDFNSLSLNVKSPSFGVIRTRLAKQGYHATLKDVKLFQEDNDLISDGVFGIKTTLMLILKNNKLLE